VQSLEVGKVSKGYNPVRIADEVKKHVTKISGGIELRRYYRFRGGRWYGGIATGDVIGCNMKCKFCWSWHFKDRYDLGELLTPEEAAERLVKIARTNNYSQVRVSGGEPTISREHLLRLISAVEESGLTFIVETNGILLGYNRGYANELANFSNVVIRVSFKGVTADEFNKLTGADKNYFELQFMALENLVNAGLKPGHEVYAAAMISFSNERDIAKFVMRLAEISPELVDVDWELVIMYPHVRRLLELNGLKPKRWVDPNKIPRSMI